MRKLFAAAVLCAGIFGTLCGCSSGKLPFSDGKQTDFDTGYTVTADITCGDLEAKADITRHGKDDWEFSFTEPKELMGLNITVDAENITASLGDLSVSAEPKGVYSSLPKIISYAVDKLPELTQSMTESEGVLTAQSEYEGEKVVITAAKDTGALISLKCPYHKLSVRFSNQERVQPSRESNPADEVKIIEE
ncbi:MAG: hypothetical protein KIG62_03635 [Oscillospiraceae bacterium]|nr:hypothetical protein [Oscillospiraceae bacterium]